MVCRFAPWWLSTGEFGQVPTGGPPLTLEQFESCSPALQPLLRHLCNDVPSNMLQQPVLDRAQAAVERAAWVRHTVLAGCTSKSSAERSRLSVGRGRSRRGRIQRGW